jgi:uncharacterized protein YjcR
VKSRFDPAAQERIKASYALSMSLEALAVEYKCSVATIRNIVKGGPPKRASRTNPALAEAIAYRRAAGMSLESIARAVGVSVTTVRNYLRRQNESHS